MDNKRVVQACFDALWKGGAPANDMRIAEDVAIHVPPFPDARGRTALSGLASMWRAAMPDLAVTTDVLFGEGDRVVQHFSLTGTHSGAPLMGAPAAGRTLTVTGVGSYRLEDGKVVEWQGLIDAAGLMQQLQA
jgi:predicted ester cyclase